MLVATLTGALASPAILPVAVVAVNATAAPLTDPILITAWRTPAAEIPTHDGDRIRWLDEQWLLVDDWVALNAHSRPRR